VAYDKLTSVLLPIQELQAATDTQQHIATLEARLAALEQYAATYRAPLFWLSSALHTAGGLVLLGLVLGRRRLGIAEAMQPRTKHGASNVTELVAANEAERAVPRSTERIAFRVVELVGPLPAEMQHDIVLTAGVGTQGREPGPARDFLPFLTAPAALPVLKTKG
jgi:hypothetical protein